MGQFLFYFINYFDSVFYYYTQIQVFYNSTEEIGTIVTFPLTKLFSHLPKFLTNDYGYNYRFIPNSSIFLDRRTFSYMISSIFFFQSLIIPCSVTFFTLSIYYIFLPIAPPIFLIVFPIQYKLLNLIQSFAIIQQQQSTIIHHSYYPVFFFFYPLFLVSFLYAFPFSFFPLLSFFYYFLLYFFQSFFYTLTFSYIEACFFCFFSVDELFLLSFVSFLSFDCYFLLYFFTLFSYFLSFVYFLFLLFFSDFYLGPFFSFFSFFKSFSSTYNYLFYYILEGITYPDVIFVQFPPFTTGQA